MRIRRPVLRYHGGKWKLAPWIISYLAAHRIYTEFSDSLSGGQMSSADVSPAGETIDPLTLSRPASVVPPLAGSGGAELASSSLEMGGVE